MTRLARAGIGVLLLLVLFLLGTAVHEVSDLSSRLGTAQGRIIEKDAQLAAKDQTIAEQARTISGDAVRDGQYVAIILTLTRQLQRAGIRPVVEPQDVPRPQPGPPVVTPAPRPRASSSARPQPRPSSSPRPQPSPSPSPTRTCLPRPNPVIPPICL